MPSKPNRKVFRIAMLKTDYEKLKDYIDTNDAPVYLTFLNTTNYRNHQKANSVMIETAFEKEES